MSATESGRQFVDAFNRVYPVGAVVRYWTGVRQGPGKLSTTRTAAQMLSGHTPVVWVVDHGACIALTHVEPQQCPHCTSDDRTRRFVMPVIGGTAPCDNRWHNWVDLDDVKCRLNARVIGWPPLQVVAAMVDEIEMLRAERDQLIVEYNQARDYLDREKERHRRQPPTVTAGAR